MKTLHVEECFPPEAARSKTAEFKLCIFLRLWTRSRKWTSEKGCASWHPVMCSQAWPQSSWIWEELELPGQGPVSCDRTIIKSPNICTSLHSNEPMNPAFTHPNQCNTMGFLVLFFQVVVFKKKLGKYIVRICQLITTFAMKWFPKVCGPCERGKSFKNCAYHRFEELPLWRLKCLGRHLKN